MAKKPNIEITPDEPKRTRKNNEGGSGDPTPTTKKEFVRTSILIDKQTHHDLHTVAIARRTSANALIMSAIRKIVEDNQDIVEMYNKLNDAIEDREGKE